ncbi:Chromosome transmission fidelity protein 8 [Apophysomyces ossiformis]|uniref:Chromosome transmission fidelity protein 8 n=1 Tax=Apophysomyces ossiformis TaxID=679940 RepID=A0A8H7BRN1_9FUNG|nr:Chromosome transmission fidelity protein 8 [Apophysomyces ossiformis]
MAQAVIWPLTTSENRKELVILDFQGSLLADDPDVRGSPIGQITFDKASATLIVGHHRLQGKKVALSKPFAVIQKREEVDRMDTDEEGIHPVVDYDVVTILREKYIFTQRPGLIVQESLRGLTKLG